MSLSLNQPFLRSFVCRIHPLHRQLQRLPAPHRAHRRGGGEHFLGLDGRIGEEGIFGAGGEIGEVGHKNQLLYVERLLAVFQ